jgi:hypothetical protein
MTAAVAGQKSSAATSSYQRSSFHHLAHVSAPLLRSGPLVVTRGRVVHHVAADGRYVVWEAGPLQDPRAPTSLLERDLKSRRTRVLARNVEPNYGLASTGGWVVFAQGNAPTRLVAVRHDGSRRTVLSRSLRAAVDARGTLIAWAEETTSQQRVVVRDMKRGIDRLAVEMRRCTHGRCYQLEQVTLADDGVVFTRDGSNPDRSLVMRRAFSDGALTAVAIARDPQPDLIPSSAGAIYYVLGRGWYRWDFGQRRPHRTRFRANPPAPLLAYEDGHWFLASRRGCDFGVVMLERNGQSRTIISPGRLRRLASPERRVCTVLEGFAWTRRQALTAWALAPKFSIDSHVDFGLVGVAFAGSAAG